MFMFFLGSVISNFERVPWHNQFTYAPLVHTAIVQESPELCATECINAIETCNFMVYDSSGQCH